jgi:hypothetical protein
MTAPIALFSTSGHPTPLAPAQPSVSITPGLIEFTRIFRTPVMASTAAFDAEYTAEFERRSRRFWIKIVVAEKSQRRSPTSRDGWRAGVS